MIRRQFKKRRWVLGLMVCLAGHPLGAIAATQQLSPGLVGKVIKAQQLADKDQLSQAITTLTAIHTANEYDNAYIHRMLGVYYWRNNKVKSAIKALSVAVKAKQFKDKEGWKTEKMLADMLLNDEQYAASLQHYNHLVKGIPQGESAPELWLRVAQLNYQLEKWPEVLTSIQQYEHFHQPDKVTPLTIKLTAQNQLKQYAAAIQTTKRLIVLQPHQRNWWLQMVGLEMTLKRYASALSSLELAHTSHVALQRSDLLLLAQLYARNGIPERAARTLAAVSDLDKDKTALIQLASYWQLAKEWDQSVTVWAKLTRFDNKYYWNIAQIQMQNRHYAEALTALKRLNTHNKRLQRQVALAKIQVLYKLDNVRLALQAAHQADNEQSTHQTRGWIKYLTQISRYAS